MLYEQERAEDLCEQAAGLYACNLGDLHTIADHGSLGEMHTTAVYELVEQLVEGLVSQAALYEQELAEDLFE